MPRDLFQYGLYFVLSVLGIVAIIAVFTDVERDTNVSQLNTEYSTFVTEMRKAHRGQFGRYGTGVISDANLITTGIAPETTHLDASTLKNNWDGDITITGATNSFNVDYDAVPQEVCIHFATRYKGDDSIQGFRIAANAAGLTAATLNPVPINLSAATGLCASTANAIRLTAA